MSLFEDETGVKLIIIIIINLWDVTRATAVAKLTYACSAWWGYVDSGGKARIQSVLNKTTWIPS